MDDYEELQKAVNALDKRFSLKRFYYPSFEDTIWYVYYTGKRVCHISIFGNYAYMNDCIDGGTWCKGSEWQLGETSQVVARWVINQANDCMMTLNALKTEADDE